MSWQRTRPGTLPRALCASPHASRFTLHASRFTLHALNRGSSRSLYHSGVRARSRESPVARSAHRRAAPRAVRATIRFRREAGLRVVPASAPAPESARRTGPVAATAGRGARVRGVAGEPSRSSARQLVRVAGGGPEVAEQDAHQAGLAGCRSGLGAVYRTRRWLPDTRRKAHRISRRQIIGASTPRSWWACGCRTPRRRGTAPRRPGSARASPGRASARATG